MKLSVILVSLLLSGAPALAQSVPAPLSSDNSSAHMVRATGMPLRDGDLPPGMLTVRVVQGGFTNNVAGQQVTVQVIGGATESATTGPDGRAQFPHMPIGGRAQAWTDLGSERLQSDEFDIPSEAGLRVLLAAGGDAIASGAPPTFEPTPAAAQVVTTPVSASAAPDAAPRTGIVAIRIVLALTSVICFGLFVFGRRYRLVRRNPPGDA